MYYIQVMRHHCLGSWASSPCWVLSDWQLAPQMTPPSWCLFQRQVYPLVPVGSAPCSQQPHQMFGLGEKKTIELHALYLKTFSYINKTHGKNILYKTIYCDFNNKMPTLGIISTVHSESWETEVPGKPGFSCGFSAITVFQLGTDSKAYCQASNSAASLIMFSRCNCYFLLHWGTRCGSIRGELHCNLCLEPLL